MEDLVEILESAGPIGEQIATNKWLVTIARPGKGSKGTYPEETLKKYGPVAFPPGTRSYFKHAATEDRDPRDQVGEFESGAFWNDTEGELQGILTVQPRYASVVKEAKSGLEASMKANGMKDSRGNFTSISFRRDNTVDLVAFGGLEGTGLKHEIVESLFAAAAAETEEEETMAFEITESDWTAFKASVTAGFAKVDTFIAESMQGVKGEADQAAVDAAVEAGVEEALATIREGEAAVDAADVPAEVKETLKESVRKGDDITETLASAVAITAALRKEQAPAPKQRVRGNVVVVAESATDDNQPASLRVSGWKRN